MTTYNPKNQMRLYSWTKDEQRNILHYEIKWYKDTKWGYKMRLYKE